MSEVVPRVRVPVLPKQEELALEAIRGGHFATGPHLAMLIDVLADRFGCRHVVPTSSAFSALFATLSALDPEAHSVVLPAASTCFAIPNAVRAAGRSPMFWDVDPDTASLTPLGVEASPRIVVAPNHFGRIAEICRVPAPRDTLLIEDAAQSFSSVGTWPRPAAATVLSFYPTKIANGVGGGAVLTDDGPLAARIAHQVDYSQQSRSEPTVRYNLAMANLHAAILLGTLHHMPAMEDSLGAAHQRLEEAAGHSGLRCMRLLPDEHPTRMILHARTAHHRQQLLSYFADRGVGASAELLSLDANGEEGDASQPTPEADRLVDTTFSVPLFPFMSEAEVARVEHAVIQAP